MAERVVLAIRSLLLMTSISVRVGSGFKVVDGTLVESEVSEVGFDSGIKEGGGKSA